MYSARRTVKTKSSSNIPIPVHSGSANVHSENEALDGCPIVQRTVVSTVETDSASTKDSGCVESENSNESGSYTESKVHSICENFNVVSSATFSATELRLELDEDVGENDDFLKEELIHIFERERSTLEQYFKNKMDDLLYQFRKKQMEWEEASRADKAATENAFTQEKTAMQKSFGEEIAKLTHTFNEERAQLEQYYKTQLKELKEQTRKEQTDTKEQVAREKLDLKETLELEYQGMLKSKIAEGKKDTLLEKAELEVQFSKEKDELERKQRHELTEEGTKLQRFTTEMEAKSKKERLELEQDFRQKITHIEERLNQERELRCEAERQLEQERMKGSSIDSSRKQEIDKLKIEIAELRHELDEKNRSVAVEVRTLEERILQGGREGLSGTLRRDFERLLTEHKMELDRSYQKDKTTLEQSLEGRLQNERNQIRVEMEQDGHWSKEVSLRGNGEMQRVEERRSVGKKTAAARGTCKGGEGTREHVDDGYDNEGRKGDEQRIFESGISNEVNYGGKTLLQNHSSSSIGEQSQTSKFYYVSPQNENALRIEINGLKRENDGLKAKVAALEENIDLHKKYKTEVQAEMKRLQQQRAEHSNDNEELLRVQAKKELKDAQSKSRDYERKLKELRAKIKEEERAASKAETNTRDVQAKVRELEKRIQALEERTKEADTRAKQAEDHLENVRQQICEVSTMNTKSGTHSVPDQKKSEKESCLVEDHPKPDKAKYEAVLSERNKLLHLVKEQKHKIHYLHQTLSSQQESSLGGTIGGRGHSDLTKENADQEQKMQDLKQKLQELFEKFKQEKQKVTSLEAELSSARSKYIEQIQGLENTVRRTGQEIARAEGGLDRDTLRRIEKEIMSLSEMTSLMSQMLKTQLNEKDRDSSVEQKERIWKLQMEKQELEIKLKMAREAMNEYVIKLNEKIKDMESGDRPSEQMVQELYTRNTHLKATLRALEQEQLRSQFQNDELVQQRTELQSLIGRLCPSEDNVTCSSFGASPRYHMDKTNRVIRGEGGEAHVSRDSAARSEDYLALRGSQHDGLTKKDSSFIQDRHLTGNCESWSGKSAKGDSYSRLRDTGHDGLKTAPVSNGNKYSWSDDISFTDDGHSSREASKLGIISNEHHGTKQKSSSALEPTHSPLSGFKTSIHKEHYDSEKDQCYTENNSLSSARFGGKMEYIYDVPKKEVHPRCNTSSSRCNTGRLKKFQYSVSNLEKDNCYY